jgi:HAD superfamily hydrolase (TIGR01490 family)
MSNLALFDFDGTITWSDTWTPFMRIAISPLRLAVGQVALSPVVIGYRLGAISASKGRCLAARVAFTGEDAAGIRRRGADYAARVLPEKVRPAAIERLDWHRSRGDDVVIVSGSLDVYLKPWCAARQLECICTMLEERDGRLTGRYVDGDCSGAEKVRRVRQRYDLSRYDLVYAYGDSGEDRELLELAHRKSYRWAEISSWDEVTAVGHPQAQ